MYDLVWSDHLLSEVERVLVGHKGLSVERAAYFCESIRSNDVLGVIDDMGDALRDPLARAQVLRRLAAAGAPVFAARASELG